MLSDVCDKQITYKDLVSVDSNARQCVFITFKQQQIDAHDFRYEEDFLHWCGENKIKFLRVLYVSYNLYNQNSNINYYMKYANNDTRYYDNACVGFVYITNEVFDRVFDFNEIKAEMYIEKELNMLAAIHNESLQ